MNSKEARIAIDRAFVELSRLCESSSERSLVLREALDVAAAQERQHRRSLGGRYKLPVETAARYFVTREALGPVKPPESWADFAATRRDIALGRALAAMLQREYGERAVGLSYARALGASLAYVDYMVHFAPERPL